MTTPYKPDEYFSASDLSGIMGKFKKRKQIVKHKPHTQNMKNNLRSMKFVRKEKQLK